MAGSGLAADPGMPLMSTVADELAVGRTEGGGTLVELRFTSRSRVA